MKKYFYYTNICSIEPAVALFPWDESVTDTVYEGSWVICTTKTVTLNEKDIIDV